MKKEHCLKVESLMTVVMKVLTVMTPMMRQNWLSKRKELKKKQLQTCPESIKVFVRLLTMTQCCSKMKFLQLNLYKVKFGQILRSLAVSHLDLKDHIIILAQLSVILLVLRKD